MANARTVSDFKAVAPRSADATLYRHAALVGTGIFLTTLTQTGVLGALPLQFLLKDHLHIGPEAMALFMQLAALPWQFKVLAGLLSDSVPIFGYRRRYYLVIAGLGAAAFWVLLGLLHHTYWTLLWVAIAMNVFLMIGSTASGALLVEEGQRFAATGRLSSLRQAVTMGAVMIGSPLGGYLAARAFGLTAFTCAALCALLIPATLLLLTETPTHRPAAGVWRESWNELKKLPRSKTLLTAAGLLFLVQVSPGFSTPLFYYQTNQLHFSSEFIGSLGLIGGATGILGSLVYAYVCKHMNLRSLLIWGIAISAAGTTAYLLYRSHAAALAITAGGGLILSFAQLPLFDLAARATPRGSEALGYAIMMAVWNIGLAVSDVAGAALYQHLGWTFMTLVWLNAGTTALVLLAVPFLPASLVGKREQEQISS